jgi:hypothetical protein
MHTPAIRSEAVEKKAVDFNISHIVAELILSVVDAFGGNPDRIEAIRSFGCHDFSTITYRQDSVLGALFGNNLIFQSKRYHKEKYFNVCTDIFPEYLFFSESERIKIYAS